MLGQCQWSTCTHSSGTLLYIHRSDESPWYSKKGHWYLMLLLYGKAIAQEEYTFHTEDRQGSWGVGGETCFLFFPLLMPVLWVCLLIQRHWCKADSAGYSRWLVGSGSPPHDHLHAAEPVCRKKGWVEGRGWRSGLINLFFYSHIQKCSIWTKMSTY